MHLRVINFLWVLLLLAACSTAKQVSLNHTLSYATQPWNGTLWWQSFNDPLLNDLACRVLEQNLDVKIAATRLAEARSYTTVVASGLYPDISGSASVVRQKNQLYPKPETVGQAGLTVNWDLDIFGQIREGIRAAQARANSVDATIDVMRNLVIADLVKAVINWRQAQETIQQTNTLLRSQNELIKLLDARAKAGLIDAFFVEGAKAERAKTATQLPQAEAASQAAQYQIERLLGIKNESIATALKMATILSIQLPAPEIVTAASLDTIRNRPDLRAARFNLIASQADLAQAEANLWPQISISSFFGMTRGTTSAHLGSNPFWTLGSSLTAPIFNFGRLSGAIDAANAQTKAAEYNYESVTLLALQEIKTALSDYLNGLNTISAQTEALKRRQEMVKIAKERFHLGLTDMTELTTANSELIQATLTLISHKSVTAEAFIRFEKAMGLTGEMHAT